MENYDSIIENSVEKEQPQHQRLTTEEWAAKKQEERARLYDMAAYMADKVFSDPQQLKSYLGVQARLGKASVNNALLAAAQKPEAGYLLSYEDWQERGRSVKRGEKAIMQLVSNGEYERQDGSTGVSMDAKKVFDVSQTYGKPVGQRAILSMPFKSKLKALTTNTPVPVRLSDHVPQNAMYDTQEREIRVARGLNGNALIYCKVYFGMTEQDEATLFAQQFGVSAPLSAGAKLRALIFAGDPGAVAFEEANHSLGIRLDYDQERGQNRLGCIRTAYDAYVKIGAERYKEAMGILKSVWNGTPDSFRMENVLGITRFVDLYHDEYNPHRLVTQLRHVDPLTIYREGRAAGFNFVGYKKYLFQVLRIYNGCSKVRALPLKF